MHKLSIPVRLVLQVFAYTAFCGVIWYFSSAPAYTRLDPALALLRVSFSHAGETVKPCRRFSPEEIAQMAPNMRRAMDCERERVPLHVQVEVDGRLLLDAQMPPSGLAGDGAASVDARLPLAAGRRRIVARLRDSRREGGFDYQSIFEADLRSGDNRVLDFRPQAGGFRLL